MGTNADGREVHSAYVVPVENGTRIAAVKKGKKLTAPQQTALRALKEAIGEFGEDAPESNHIPADAKIITMDHWREFAYRAGISASDAPRARQVAFQRAVEGLTTAHAVNVYGAYAWVTEK